MPRYVLAFVFAVAQSLGGLKWRQLRPLFDGWEDEATQTLAGMEQRHRRRLLNPRLLRARRLLAPRRKAAALRQCLYKE